MVIYIPIKHDDLSIDMLFFIITRGLYIYILLTYHLYPLVYNESCTVPGTYSCLLSTTWMDHDAGPIAMNVWFKHEEHGDKQSCAKH